MVLSVFNKPVRCLSRWVSQAWSAQIQDLRCTAMRNNQSVDLPGWLLSSAEETCITFTVRQPRLALSSPRHVRISLAASHSRVNFRDPRSAIALLSARDALVPLEATRWRVEQSITGRTNQVRVRLSSQALVGYETLQMEIRDKCRGSLLGRLCFKVVSEARAQQLRLEGLRANSQQLWIQSGYRRYPGALVADTSDFVIPEISLAGSELDAILPPREAGVNLSLLFQCRKLQLDHKRSTLGSSPIRVETAPPSLKDRSLFPGPGSYCLLVTVDARLVATLPFRIVDQHEWLQQVKVSCVNLETEGVDGRTRLQVGALRWNTHLAFRPLLRIVTAIPAPNTPVQCVGCILLEDKVLHREEFTIRLDETSQQISMERFNLQELGASMQAKRVQLTLTIHLNHALKITWPVIILPAEPLSNFEGQLRCNDKELPLDEEAYNEILLRLASNPALPKALKAGGALGAHDERGREKTGGA